LNVPKSVYKRKPKRLPKSLGFSRYSLDFDEVDDYVKVLDDPSLSGMSGLTVSAWVDFDTHPGHIANVAKKDLSYILRQSSGVDYLTLYVWVGGTHYSVDTGPIPTGEWHYVSGAYDGGEMRIYLDGNLKDSNSSMSGDIDASTTNLGMGGAPDGTELFDGEVDEVRIYSRALSAEEIRRNMLNYHSPTKNGLVGWWRFREGTGLTAHDESENGNDGTLNPSGDPPIWTDVKKWEPRAEVGL